MILTVRRVRRRLDRLGLDEEEEWREEPLEDEDDSGELSSPPSPPLGACPGALPEFGKGGCPEGGPFELGDGSP